MKNGGKRGFWEEGNTDCRGVMSENKEVVRMKKTFKLEEGMAVGMKLVCTESNEIRDEIHVGEN